MRIQFERSGGFAGVTRKASIDTTRLPPAEKAQLETLANAMDFDRIPPPKPGPSADRFQYRLTISNGGGRKTASFADGQVTPPLKTKWSPAEWV